MELNNDSSKSNQAYKWMNENSLKNLKLGSEARRKGKVKLNLTVLPEVAEDLKRSGNASRFVELLLQAHKDKRLLDPSELL
jgi:hypothetical protein